MTHAPRWFFDMVRPPVWLVARVAFGVRYRGLEHVPAAGPVLLVPNHVSYMDPVLITIPIRRPMHYMTLEPFFRVPVFGSVLRWFRAFPVREDEVEGHAVRRAIRLLRAAEPLVIFPEGGRSTDGRLLTFRAGAFRVALHTDTPVVPVTIAGAFEAWPASRRLPRPGRVTITYHPALTRKDLPQDADRKSLPGLLTELVRQRIAGALPPEPPTR